MRLPKPEPRKRIKARERRQFAAARKRCRDVVLERDNWRCQRCGVPVGDIFPDWHPQRAHVNEKVPRSRGGDPTDPNNCETLCQWCHMPNGRHAPTAARLAKLKGAA